MTLQRPVLSAPTARACRTVCVAALSLLVGGAACAQAAQDTPPVVPTVAPTSVPPGVEVPTPPAPMPVGVQAPNQPVPVPAPVLGSAIGSAMGSAVPPVAMVPAAPAQALAAWARVVSVKPVQMATQTTQTICREVSVQPTTSGAGAVVGAVAGAVLGSQVGGGSGQALATAAGMVGGAVLGDRAEADGRAPQTTRQCVVQPGGMASMGYEVVYEYAGQHYVTMLPQHPGALLQVQVSPAGAVMPLVANMVIQAPVPAYYYPPAVVVGVGGYGRHRGYWGPRHWRY